MSPGSAPAPARASTPASVAPAQAAPRHEAVFYDLAQHAEHAELRRGETLLMDFGAAGDAKYTLGGFGTRVRSGVEHEGDKVAVVQGAYGEITVPTDAADREVALRVRVMRKGDLRIRLDGELVKREQLDPGAFAQVSLRVPNAGEHRLQLQSSGMGRFGGLSTGLALDWVQVGPTLTQAALPALKSDGRSLSLPAELTAGYALRVPERARLTAPVVCDRDPCLAVSVRSGGAGPAQLGTFGPGPLALDLSGLAGKFVRVDLTARAEVALETPRIVVARDTAAAERPEIRNVLIYLIDTLRVDHLPAFNPKTRVRTPGIDSFAAKQTALFSAAHTQENWTKPSVATLLSSLLPWEHHAVTTAAVVPNAIELLPEKLSEMGFYTGAFIANGYVSDKFGFKQGWDTYRNYIREHLRTRGEFLAADVLRWLDKRPAESPFFLYVHAIDPHVPYRPTKQFMQLYDPEPYHGVVNFSRDATLLEKIKGGAIKLSPRDKAHLEALYDSEISYHDQHFRTIMRALDERNLSDDTLVVVVSDHGEEFWDHGSVGHGHNIHEELLHIPMLVRVPGLSTEAVAIDSPVGLVDVVPTVLEALGEPVPKDLSGSSFYGELTGELSGAPRTAVSGFMDDWRTLVADGYKLIEQPGQRFSVHDLSRDPKEERDVASEQPLVTRYLRGRLGLTLERSTPRTRGGRRRRPVKKQETTIDAETEAQLRALGYVDGSRR